MNTRQGARELAKDIAERSPCCVQVGAVLSDNKGRIISWGWNHYDVNGSDRSTTIHAEEHAISRANPKRLRTGKVTLSLAGQWNKNNNLVYARPCTDRCMPAAQKHGVDTIEYRNKDGSWKVLKLKYV